MATKKAKIETTNFVATVKNTAIDTNDFLLETADELVNVAVKRGAQWQTVANKAIGGGLKLAETNQEIVFDTLELLKGQVKVSAKRFKTLFSKN